MAGLIGYGSDEEEEREKRDDSRGGMEVAELQLTDWGSLACLLCARQFQTREKLQKHNTMSDLHTKNLEEWRTRRGKGLGKSQEQDQDQTYQYKDRAKERRKKFGKEELPPENKFKDKYMAAMADVAASGAPTGADAPKLDDSNLGNRCDQIKKHIIFSILCCQDVAKDGMERWPGPWQEEPGPDRDNPNTVADGSVWTW